MSMSKVLIANRGEIAVRVARGARDVGLASVAVYADPDAGAAHVRLADEAYALPGSTSADTYLNIDKLLEVAERSGADAVHPGYGFLSESADFARAVSDAGLTWIGPDPETIELLGDKGRARALAAEVGAPLAPGTNDPVESAAQVQEFAAAHGLPIVIKAVAGGGGRGMRVVHQESDIESAYESAVREATAAFGKGDCLVERFLDRPRHIEAQVLGDRHGRVAVIGTRDCSLQRRNQKLVEEAPAPFLLSETEDRIRDAAHAICAKAGYVGAGTLEFLLSDDGVLSFLEVNTRLQVEHTVTEEVTGIDLVAQQFRIADGLPMDVPDDRIPQAGHAIEFRINAEDPALGFLPTPGTINRWDVPAGPGIRIDSGFGAGDVVSGSFDSLLAKLIVTGRDREQAFARARRALREFTVDGVATVLPFDRYIVDEPAFTGETADTTAQADEAAAADRTPPGGHGDRRRGDGLDAGNDGGQGGGFGVHTRWIEDECTADFSAAPAVPESAAPTLRRLPVEIDGKLVVIGLPDALLAGLGAIGSGDQDGGAGSGSQQARSDQGAAAPGHDLGGQDAEEEGAVVAPFAGTLSMWKVDDGSTVEEGQTIAILEAMKMEVPVTAPAGGTLTHGAQEGQAVTGGERIAQVGA